MRAAWMAFSAALPALCHAQWSLQLAKKPENPDWAKPAIFSYQRNDGGATSYLTQGTLAYGIKAWEKEPFGAGSNYAPSARFTWAKNTLKDQEQDTRGLRFNNRLSLLTGDRTNAQNALDFNLAIGADRNRVKDQDAATGELSATLSRDELISSLGARPFAFAVFPTVGGFVKDVRSAPEDKTTGITPTGFMRGYYASVSATLIPSFLADRGADPSTVPELLRPRRWAITFTSQLLRTTSVLPGQVKDTHRLHQFGIAYSFSDPPLVKSKDGDSKKVIPGLTLSRQVGDDPWNDVPKGGFTLLAFTLKY